MFSFTRAIAVTRWRGWSDGSRRRPIAHVHMLAVLAHDFGKPATTQHAMKDGVMRIISPGHEEAGAALAAAFLERIARRRLSRRGCFRWCAIICSIFKA